MITNNYRNRRGQLHSHHLYNLVVHLCHNGSSLHLSRGECSLNIEDPGKLISAIAKNGIAVVSVKQRKQILAE